MLFVHTLLYSTYLYFQFHMVKIIMCTHIIGIVYYAEEMLIIIHFKGVGPKLMLSLLRIIHNIIMS